MTAILDDNTVFGSVLTLVLASAAYATEGACCFPDTTCTLEFNATCGILGGEFQGIETSCDGVVCPDELHWACCLGETCVDDTLEAKCELVGGEFEYFETCSDLNDDGSYAPWADVFLTAVPSNSGFEVRVWLVSDTPDVHAGAGDFSIAWNPDILSFAGTIEPMFDINGAWGQGTGGAYPLEPEDGNVTLFWWDQSHWSMNPELSEPYFVGAFHMDVVGEGTPLIGLINNLEAYGSLCGPYGVDYTHVYGWGDVSTGFPWLWDAPLPGAQIVGTLTGVNASDTCADYVVDGTVNVLDLLEVITNWGNPYNVNDILAVLDGWGDC